MLDLLGKVPDIFSLLKTVNIPNANFNIKVQNSIVKFGG